MRTIKNTFLKEEWRVFKETLHKNLLFLENKGWNGEAEDLILRLTQKMAEKMPNARYVEIPGAGHLLPNERPAEINRLVTDFLRDLGRDAA